MTDRKRYFEDAVSWATDARQRESRALRMTRLIAGVAAGIAVLEAIALVMLTPLKTVQAVTVLVDRQTGYVQTLDPNTPQRVEADAALTTSMLAQYVVAREGFDRATIGNDYQHVSLWSGGLARAQYLALMPASNPQSPLQRYPLGEVVVAHVKSVSPLSSGTALVRFETQQQDRNGRTTIAEPWVAVIQFRYSDAAMSFDKRLVNPLGFQVTSYRRDHEAPATTFDSPIKAFASSPPKAPADVASPRIYSSVPATAAVATYPYDLSHRGLLPNQIPSGSPLGPVGGYRAQLPTASQ